MSHLIRIRNAGVQHNDLEPRNVVVSQSLGPIIIDFDSASLDHCCEGPSCRELRELAGCLGIDPGVELSTTERVTFVSTDVVTVAVVSFLVMWIMSVWKVIES
ncbi:hypothetical protein B0H19DRAFT_684871 [Mycena capillaripes]|nr:hypothetical protein B0H19DRAFT_684871 [Mycena capillaripes]